jgi:hypothetical protein
MREHGGSDDGGRAHLVQLEAERLNLLTFILLSSWLQTWRTLAKATDPDRISAMTAGPSSRPPTGTIMEETTTRGRAGRACGHKTSTGDSELGTKVVEEFSRGTIEAAATGETSTSALGSSR